MESAVPPPSRSLASARESSRRGVAVFLVALIAIVGSVFTGVASAPRAEAFYGPGGLTPSPYLDMINWVDWKSLIPSPDYDGNGSDGRAGTISKATINQAGGATVTSTTTIGDSRVIVRCTLSNTSGDLALHAPGQYGGDTFDDYYDAWTGSFPLSGALSGIGASGKGNTRKIAFDVSCNASLSRPGQSDTPLPISGLVFANAEAIDLNEFFNIAPQKINPDVPVTWRVLENPAPQCGTNYSLYLVRGALEASSRNTIAQSNLPNVEMSNALQIFGPRDNCFEQNNGDGPFVSVFAEGATGARIQTYPQSNYGANYLAIGVVLTTDYSDGYNTNAYGNAAAMIQPAFSGGELPATDLVFNSDYRNVYQVRSRNLDIATKAQDVTVARRSLKTLPRIGLNTDVGVDGDLAASSFADVFGNFYTFQGDDSTSLLTQRIDDEDAVAGPLLVPALAGNTYRLNVTCQAAPSGTTKVAAWLDWNANRSFDATEKAVSDCVNSTATLKWTPTQSQLPSVTTTNRNPRESALRIITTTDTATLATSGAATATYLNGEVEDHPVTLVMPNLQLTKEIVGVDNSPLPSVSASGWELTATGQTSTALRTDSGVAQSVMQTTPASGSVLWLFNPAPADTSPEIDLTDPQFVEQQFTLTEKQKSQYRLAPQVNGTAKQNIVCAQVTKPTGWNDTFAWPSATPQMSNIESGATVAVDAKSVLDCGIKNQPYGQISVTPSVDAGSVTGIDSQLEFSGEYRCVAPPESTFAGEVVTGKWGPITAGKTWTSDVTRDKIALGAECTITQTAITSAAQPAFQAALPVVGDYRYMFGSPVYSPQGQGSARVLADAPATMAGQGHSIPVATIANPVVEVPTARVTFTKVDESQRLIGGAEFSLSGGPNNAISLTIIDADGAVAGAVDGDSDGGEFTVAGLPAGQYTLKETQAPAGFALRSSPLSFEITEAEIANGYIDLGAIVNTRAISGPLPGIPMSGGTGTIVYTVGGAIALLCAFGFGFAALHRRKEQAH